MTEVGAVEFRASIGTDGLRGDIAKINQLLSRETLKLRVSIDAAQIRTQLDAALRNLKPVVRIGVALDRAQLTAAQQQIAKATQSTGVRAAAAPTAPTGFAKSFDAALGRQAKEAQALAREFERTAKAAERAAASVARINIRKQEQEATALARQLQQAERAAGAAATKAQQLTFKRQQGEVAALARDFDKAAAAQQRLQQTASRDKQTLSGARFSDRETKALEASIGRVRQQTQKADQTAALLRQKYKLTDDEVKKITGSLGGVNQQSKVLSQTLNNFGTNLIGQFLTIQAGIQILQAAIGAIVGTFTKASASFREFEANLLSFQAKSQGVEVDLEGLADEISRVAKITSQSPGSLSAAASSLVSFGVAAGEVEGRLDTLAKSSDVLKESPEDLARVFQGALAAYEQYGVGIEEVSDLVTQAVNTTAIGARSGALELEQLFSKAAAPAATLGATLDELLTLDALFAGAGARPEARATAVEVLLTRIASQKDQLEKEGVVIAVKENGGLDVEGTLLSIRDRLEEIPDTAGRLNLLKSFFGESAGNDILTAITRIDTGYAAAAESIGKSNGALQRGFDIVSQGTEFQAGVVTGGFEDAFNELGKAINPVEKAFIALQQAVFGATDIDLSPLTESAERLRVVLSDNPELVEALAAALSGFANAAVDQLASVLDALTALSANDSLPGFIESVGQGLETLVVALGRFVQGVIGFGELIAPLFAQREVFPGVETSIAGLLTPISLLVTAFKVIRESLIIATDAVTKFAERFPLITAAVVSAIPGLREAIAAFRLLKGALPGGDDGEPLAFASSVPQGVSASKDALDSFSAAVDSVRDDVNEGEPIGPEFNVRQEGLSAESGLKRFADEQTKLLKDIEAADSTAQIDLTSTGADPSAFIEQERKTLDDRIKVRETFINQLKELEKRPGISVAESLALEQALAESEKELAGDRLAVAQNFQKERADILRQASQDQQQAIAEIEREASAVAASIAEQNLGPRDAATAAAASEQEGLRDRLKNRRTFLAELKKLEDEGGLSAEQALDVGSQIIAAETQINQDRAALATSLETERQRVLQQSLDDQLAALQIFRDRESQVLESRKSDLEGQSSIATAENQVTLAGDNSAAAQLGLERDRLETLKAQAEAVGDIAGARRIDSDIAQLGQQSLTQQAAATQRQLEFKRQQLGIELQVARIEAQRQQLIANIAVKEAELNIQKAIGTRASAEEIGNLRQVLALRQEIADDATKGIRVTEQVFESQFKEIGIEEQLAQTEQLSAAEDQRQENIGKAKELVDQEIAAKQRLLSAEKALVDVTRARASALISALNAQRATTEESQEQLRAIRERFKEAQGAGLFQGLGGEFERAAGQLQGILAQGGKLQDLVKFARGTDNAIARQLLGGVGRGDVVSLLDADEQQEDVSRAESEAGAARKAADDILIAEIGNASESMLIAFQEGGGAAALLIRQALSIVTPQGQAVQSLRSGGVVDGAPGGVAPVQLHRDEFAFAPVGTRVISQNESRRLVAQHLANAPGLSIPDLTGGAMARAAMRQSIPTAGQMGGAGLEKRFDKLIELVGEARTKKDGGQTNYFSLSSQGEAARIAAEMRAVGRRTARGMV